MESILVIECLWASGLFVNNFDVADETLEPLVVEFLLLLQDTGPVGVDLLTGGGDNADGGDEHR